MKKQTVLLLICSLLLALVAAVSLISILHSAGVLFSNTSAQPAALPQEAPIIGISLPEEEDPHWSAVGSDLQQRFEKLGYQVFLAYADSDAGQQATQLEDLIAVPVDCLIIAAVDSAVLTQVEQTAKEMQIPVIAYDRLLMDTDAVSYCVSFDYQKMGEVIAQYIIKAKALDAAAEGESFTIEFFMGSPDDNNALQLYQGIKEVLWPYLDRGVLVCKTGRTAFEDTCIVGWQEQTAKDNCAAYLAEYYTQETLDICCTVSDSFASGCIEALEAAGCDGENWPLITGQDATDTGQKNICSGKQAMSVSKDQGLLREKCVDIVDALFTGAQPQVDDTQSCYNNVLEVPACLCGFEVVDASSFPEEAAEDETKSAAKTQPTTESTSAKTK